jgi:hypothetical protein
MKSNYGKIQISASTIFNDGARPPLDAETMEIGGTGWEGGKHLKRANYVLDGRGHRHQKLSIIASIKSLHYTRFQSMTS